MTDTIANETASLPVVATAPGVPPHAPSEAAGPAPEPTPQAKPTPKPTPKGTRRPAAARKALVARIWRAADRHMAEIEARMPGLGSPEASERDARTLAMLARLVRELAAMEGQEQGSAGRAAAPGKGAARRKAAPGTRSITTQEVEDDAPWRDIDAFRDELARRLERLRQARSGA